VLHVFEPATNSRDGDRIHRSPAVPVVGAVALGIAADHCFAFRFEVWWIATVVVLSLALICWRQQFSLGISAMVLAACIGLAGCWHHWNWDCVRDNEISTWATDRDRPIHLIAKVLQVPLILKTNQANEIPWQVPERTVTVIACESLTDSHGTPVRVSGRTRLTIVGRLDDLAIGDRIEIVGILARPLEPANPGEFDSRMWMRSHGLNATVVAEFPEAVRVIEHDLSLADRLAVVRATVRKRAEDLISDHLSVRTAAVAQSLLLGSRVEIDRDLRLAFAESGTLHVLAISGMNVGLLWMWLWKLFRVFRCSPTVSLLAVLLLLPAYAFITDANPPVVRATIVAMVLACGQLGGRNASKWNSLAIAALFVLIWNPSDLFNAGAQLSFVAVVAILLTTSFLKSIQPAIDFNDGPIAGGAFRRVAMSAARFVFESYVVGLGIWVMTSPLIASQFHIVSPIGVLLNVVLAPLIAVMFWLGYSFLLLGMVLPMLFGWLGVPFDITLGWFLSVIEWAAKLDLGHNYVPAPEAWWTIGFYVLMLSLLIVDHRRGRIYWSARVVLAWAVLGLALSFEPNRNRELSCTVLSVGHGLSVLIECPNGRTLLYDAGSMMGGSRTARTIASALWTAGKSRLDAVVVSHADADHCNALPDLLEVVPIRTLFAHRTFLDWKQPPVAAAIERSTAAGVPIQLLSAGQFLQLDSDVSICVLHPAPNFRGATDNSNSIVLRLEYGGRRILLTGDLEREGLIRLMESERMKTDILLSPHHGSLAANSADFARWTNPERLIVSCRDDSVRQRLVKNFGDAVPILTTARFGAIRCKIRSDGQIFVDPFKPPSLTN